ncbi:MAG: tRNA 2-selenouridine(34) synthase MnmH [Ferruginibacter sp.]
MAIQKISPEQLQELSGRYPILDVRSPGEYVHAQIPGAYSLPLFTDEERKKIGTAYKQESREMAIKYGLDFFGVKMRPMVEEAEKIIKNYKPDATSNPEPQNSNGLLVHCWRGGMRSSAVAWLLNFYGFNIYLLEGGYKAYRNWVLQQFEKKYDFNIVGGYTGSGKTELLKMLLQNGHAIIDLEGLANHKGSAFGALGQPPQPKQEMFENLLATALDQNRKRLFWLEDESQRIGSLNIPHSFWDTMRSKPVYFMDIPFEQRLDHICSGYGAIEKEFLINAIVRIKKRLGPLETKTAIGFLLDDDVKECFRILLSYYDKTYLKALQGRENLASLLNKIGCAGVDNISNTEKLISCAIVNT